MSGEVVPFGVTLDPIFGESDAVLASPFRAFGLDSLVAEKIFSFLDVADIYACLFVSQVTCRNFLTNKKTYFQMTETTISRMHSY